jgi:hypothetical protein
MNHTRKVSSGLFAGSIAVSLILGAVLAAGIYVAEERDTALAFVTSGGLLCVFGEIMFLVLLYKAWASIQGGPVRTTPGKAVGFLFIPVYNWYWLFQVLPGFADDYNAYIQRFNIYVPRLERGLLLGFAVLASAAVVPVVGLLVAPIVFIIQGVIAVKLCGAINALAEVASPSTVAAATTA